MDWTGESSWISETSWRAGSIALAGGVCIGLALVHYTDPGVIKPNPHGVDPAVAEYLSIGRPVCEFFFNDTATTEIYTRKIVGSVRCV